MLCSKEEQSFVWSISIQTGSTKQGSSGNIIFRSQNLGYFAINRQGRLIRNTIWSLHKANRITLVFDRNKSTRNACESKASEQDSSGKGRHHDRAGFEHLVKDFRITLFKAWIKTIEVNKNLGNKPAHNKTNHREQDHRDEIGHTNENQTHNSTAYSSRHPQWNRGELHRDKAH